jgi:flagellar hook-associated protein 3 FlgL
MRIPTTQIYLQGVEAFAQQQSKLAILQQQISTGVRLTNPSDDPVASSQVLGLDQSVSLQKQYQKNIDSADNRLKFQESAFNTLENTANRLRELAIQSNTASMDAVSLRAIGVEVESIIDEMVAIGNTRDANGDFLFGGYQNRNPPFTPTLTGSINHVVYNGDEGQRFLQISETSQIAVDNPGSEVFLRLASPTALNETPAAANTGAAVLAPANVSDASLYVPGDYEIRFTAPGTYDVFDVTNGVNIVTAAAYSDSVDINFQGIRTSITGTPNTGDVFTVSQGQNKSIFESARELADTLNDGTAGAQRAANIAEFLGDVDTFMNSTLNFHTSVGASMNNIQSQKESNEANILDLEAKISSLRDTDLAEAISQLSLEQTTLDAAQAVFARITSSSLFNFLR